MLREGNWIPLKIARIVILIRKPSDNCYAGASIHAVVLPASAAITAIAAIPAASNLLAIAALSLHVSVIRLYKVK